MTRTVRATTPLFSALAAFCALTAHAAPPAYTIQPIQQNHPELLVPVPGVMNNTGQLAGYAYSVGAADINLALWNNAVLTNGGDTPHSYLGLIDMNDSGQVLGYTVDDERGIHGFIYKNGTYTSIPNFQYGPGINASGKVPFWNPDMEGYFLWNNGNSTPLPMTATVNGATHELSEPYGINDNDEIAYVSYSPLFGVPSLYVQGAQPFAVPAPEQYLSGWLVGINNSRQMAGEFLTGTEQRKPFLYSDNGTRGHGTYQIFDADYHLLRLNGRGEVLAQKDSDGEYAIFHDNAWHNLDACVPTGWTVACTYDMNDKGEIAALLFDAGQMPQLAILKPNGTPSGSGTLRGQVGLPNPNGKTINVTVTGSTTQTATATLDAQGKFTLPITVTGAATVRIKAANTLSSKVNLTLVNGENVLPATVNLRGGDANNDNVVDITDLLQLIAHYNSVQPSANYLAAADFDNNGTNDISDLLLMIANYNRVGE